MTKNIFSDNRIETTLSAEKNSFKRNTTDIWKEFGYFKQQSCDFGVDKENLPENSIIYLNQSYQSYKDNKKVYYGYYFLLGQVNECIYLPEDLQSYELGQREIKIFRPRYDTIYGKLKGLHEILGYIIVRGDADEHFLDYGFSKQNSKILSSFYKKRMPNSFSVTFFNRYRIQYESRAFQTNRSHVHFYLLCTKDRIEKINRHLGSINLMPVDKVEENFEVEGNVAFDPSKLHYENPDTEKISKAFFKMLKRIIELSNANLK